MLDDLLPRTVSFSLDPVEPRAGFFDEDLSFFVAFLVDLLVDLPILVRR